jgi:hypothetical protein
VILDPIRPYLTLIKIGVGILLLVFCFIGGCHHGAAPWKQKWENRNIADKAAASVAKAEHEKLVAKADAATAAAKSEAAANQAWRDSHPIGPVRLCNDRSRPVSSSPAADPGHAGTGTAAGGVQPVPAGDSGPGPGDPGVDIGPLLDALGALGDRVSGALRQWQAR